MYKPLDVAQAGGGWLLSFHDEPALAAQVVARLLDGGISVADILETAIGKPDGQPVSPTWSNQFCVELSRRIEPTPAADFVAEILGVGALRL